jgi:hypothetical protein
VNSRQRAILYFTPGPQGWTSTVRVNSAFRGKICPLGGMFTPSFTPRVSTVYLEEWRSGQRISLQGPKFTRPWGQSLFLGVKLRMGLWSQDNRARWQGCQIVYFHTKNPNFGIPIL